jgi:hypothetical protein
MMCIFPADYNHRCCLLDRRYAHAFFIIDILHNLTRVEQFCAPLVDESVLPLLLHLMDCHPTNELLERASGVLLHISAHRRNRREIASSGIVNHLDRLFSVSYGATRSNALTMLGNLLDAGIFTMVVSCRLPNMTADVSVVGLFHDKIDKPEILSHILSDMFLLPSAASSSSQSVNNLAPQLIAVAFFFAQLASTSHRACREILFTCNALPKILAYLRPLSDNAMTAAAAGYLWTCLVNLSHDYADRLLAPAYASMLFREIYSESSAVLKASASSSSAYSGFIEDAAQVAYNLSLSISEGVLEKEEMQDLVQAVRQTLRFLTSAATAAMNAKITMLRALVNLMMKCVSARILAFASSTSAAQGSGSETSEQSIVSILEHFVDQYISYSHSSHPATGSATTVFEVDSLCLSLINSLSMEESLILKLFEYGSLKFLLSIHDRSFARSSSSLKQQNQGPPGSNQAPTRRASLVQRRESFSHLLAMSPSTTVSTNKADSTVLAEEVELGRRMLGATIHNLMIKRPILVPGTIACMLALLKNSRDGRVVLCMRAMAHMSLHPKSKISLAREAGTLIPELAAIMRFGCDDADRVQHYG